MRQGEIRRHFHSDVRAKQDAEDGGSGCCLKQQKRDAGIVTPLLYAEVVTSGILVCENTLKHGCSMVSLLQPFGDPGPAPNFCYSNLVAQPNVLEAS